jgi:hypothetical protein
MTSTHLLAAGSPAPELAGLGVQYWFGLVLLLLAFLLVLAQVWVSVHPPAVPDAAQAKALREAANTLSAAAERVQNAAGKSQEAARQIDQASMSLAGANLAGSIDIQSLQAQTVTAKGAADDAAEGSEQAKQAADEAAQKSASLLDMAGTVAAKLPLLGGAIVFVLLGCAVAGFITISFG